MHKANSPSHVIYAGCLKDTWAHSEHFNVFTILALPAKIVVSIPSDCGNSKDPQASPPHSETLGQDLVILLDRIPFHLLMLS